MDDVLISGYDAGKTFEVRQGDTIVVSRTENPSTGYRWEIEIGDAHVVALQSSEFVTDLRAKVGAPGIRTFTLKALFPGTSKVRLTLKRGWEPYEAAIDRFEVTIDVHDRQRL